MSHCRSSRRRKAGRCTDGTPLCASRRFAFRLAAARLHEECLSRRAARDAALRASEHDGRVEPHGVLLGLSGTRRFHGACRRRALGLALAAPLARRLFRRLRAPHHLHQEPQQRVDGHDHRRLLVYGHRARPHAHEPGRRLQQIFLVPDRRSSFHLARGNRLALLRLSRRRPRLGARVQLASRALDQRVIR